MERALLASVISGTAGQQIDADADAVDALLACARAEGVVALASQSLCSDVATAEALRPPFVAAARAAAANHLILEGACTRVLEVLQAARIPVLMLKGLALGQWLYPAAYLRESSDIDLLFASHAEASLAAAALAPVGYATMFSPGDMAHEFLCRRAGPGAPVDLDMHWRLASMPVLRDRLSFDELLATSIALPQLGPSARGLGAVHAFVHACIHRAENLCANLGDRLKWLFDLHLLAKQFSAAEWTALTALCLDRGLCGVCVEAVDAAAASFGEVVPAPVLQAWRDGRTNESLDATRLADWRYMQRRNLAALPSWWQRLRWMQQRTFPPAGYLRELYGVETGWVPLWGTRLRRALGRLRG